MMRTEKDPRNEWEALDMLTPKKQRGYRFHGAMKPRPVPPPSRVVRECAVPASPPKVKTCGWLVRHLDRLISSLKATP
jgi:hypothetical protein